jgi:outer membrane protein
MRLLLVLLLLSAVALPAGGQQSEGLSLDDAWGIAAENNPAYQRAQNALITADAARRQSWGAFLPDLRLSLSSGGYLSRTFTGADEFGQPIRRPDPLEYTGSSSSQGVSVSVPVFDGGARYRLYRAARAAEEAVAAGVLVEASTLRAELARRYYDAGRREALIRLEEELLKSAESRHAATERLVRIASASPVDLLGAELAVARQKGALEQARGEAEKAMLLLQEQMGVDDAAARSLSTTPPGVFDPATLAADSLVARAFAMSPRLAQIEAQLRVVEQQRKAAGASRWPTVGVSAGFNRGIGTSGYGSLFDPNPPNQNFNFGLSLSVPLFTRYAASYQMATARVAAMNAGEDARAARLTVEREIRSALIDLQSAYRQVQLMERGRELARRQVELANQQFRLGSLQFVAFQTIIDSAALAERDALNARYAFAGALATIEEKIGGPVLPVPAR